MNELAAQLDFRPWSQVDEAYMESSMEFLKATRLIEFINFNRSEEDKINLDTIELAHFKEWLMLLGGAGEKVELDPDKRVSFTIALTKFHTIVFPDDVSAEYLASYLRTTSNQFVVRTVMAMREVVTSLELLHTIVHR